jgi:hypothetical protein
MESIAIYKNCLFCFNHLTDENRFREHIFPESILGFLKSKDICCNCGQIFGDQVDSLAIRHPSIIDALNKLGNPKAPIYAKNLPYFTQDKGDDSKLEIIKSNQGFRIKYTDGKIDDNILPWILNKKLTEFPDDIALKEKTRILDELAKAKPGQIVKSDLLHKGFIKKQAKGTFIDLGNIEPITPLIAKITVFMIFYFINPSQINKIKYMEVLIKHAKQLGNIKPIFINEGWDRSAEPLKYIHRVIFNFYPNMIYVRISLFMCLQWYLVLDINAPIIMNNNNKNIEVLGLKLDLSNQQIHPLII